MLTKETIRGRKNEDLIKNLSTLKELKIIGRLGNILHQAETNELV